MVQDEVGDGCVYVCNHTTERVVQLMENDSISAPSAVHQTTACSKPFPDTALTLTLSSYPSISISAPILDRHCRATFKSLICWLWPRVMRMTRESTTSCDMATAQAPSEMQSN